MLDGQESRNGHEAWYLAQLRPGGLGRATLNLTRQGYESFMPVHKETYRRAGQWKNSAKPLFPGYIFVKVLNNKCDWQAINSTYGISRLVTLEKNRPTQVAFEIIDALKERVLDDGKLQSPTELNVGDQVKVVSGLLSDKFAEIEAIPDRDRIYVLLECMGRYIRTELPSANVERLPTDLMSRSA